MAKPLGPRGGRGGHLRCRSSARLLYLARMRVLAICFDFGGTLDGPGDHWLPRFSRLYAGSGLSLPTAALRDAFAHATRRGYADRRVAGMSLAELARFHIETQLEYLGIDGGDRISVLVDRFVADANRALSDSRAVLERLHRRYSLGVISNFYGNVDRILEEAGIAPLLTTIIDSNRVGVSKPAAAIFQLAIDDLGCEAGDVLYVGDSFEKDVVGARRAGLRAAWLVADEAAACREPELVDLRLRRLGELEAVLS